MTPRLPHQEPAPSWTHLGLRVALQLPQPLLLLTQLRLCRCCAHATHLGCQPCHLSVLHVAHLQQVMCSGAASSHGAFAAVKFHEPQAPPLHRSTQRAPAAKVRGSGREHRGASSEDMYR